MSDKLLPCPFCAGEAEFERMGNPRQSCIVACSDCGCRLETNETWQASGNRWNTRALAQPAPGGREAALSRPVSGEPVKITKAEMDAIEDAAIAGKPLLAAPPAAAGRDEPRALIDERLADLRSANDVLRVMNWDKSSEIQRNDREIRWLIDLRSILALGPTVSPQNRATSMPTAEQWRNDAFEKAALIVMQYRADPAIAFDIRALKSDNFAPPAPDIAVLKQAEAAFEFIRIKLIGHLEEPERSAFWKAVEARDALRAHTLPRAQRGTDG